MGKKLIICEINEEYLKTVKKQMKKQNMPMPNDYQITIAHKPVAAIEVKEPNCNCEVCRKISSI